MDFKNVNRITGWAIFLIASIVYIMCIEPTASFWDCGEFIASAYKLQVGHPPGAPLFAMITRMFTVLVDPTEAAYMVNMASALSSSFTILFLFWSITILVKKYFARQGDVLDKGNIVAAMVTGAIGALTYTFSDSFWFSAVEGEVYAMSSLFTAIVFWAILKYDEVADQPFAGRWIVIIAYLMGLSIGVHLLNLLAIPAIGFVYYFRNYKTTRKGIIYTFLASAGALGVIQGGIIPGSVKLASKFELLFVNTFGMPFFSGVFAFMLLAGGLLIYGMHYTKKNHKPVWNLIITSVAMILLGYSTFATIVIRSQANTPMDENDPQDMFSLLSYINREQYGDRPLAYGQYWMAPGDAQNPRSDGNPVYAALFQVRNNGRVIESYKLEHDAKQYVASQNNPNLTIDETYIITDDKKGDVYNYDPAFCSIFPRMYSSQENHIEEYKRWSKFEGKPVQTKVRGENTIIRKPTIVENMRFFFRYQTDWMYWRYFMWNFVGRQNDIQGHGDILSGNWLSGVNFVDEQRLGTQENLPESFTNNKGYNRFFFLPFILGLIGFVFQLVRNPRMWIVTFLLFFMTGMAIVVFLNQYPFQPRERDYAYAGSFYAFAIWVGFGALALYEFARNGGLKDLKKIAPYLGGTFLVLFLLEALGGNNHGISYSVGYMSVVALILISIMIFVGKNIKNNTGKALLSLLLAIPAPFLMAKDGWNDHSRAKRRTAVDFAKNYLDSCKPNAILFTNGDNDTFPIWYVQEVEGYRTDVRVVNLSLLNTDWYVNQMKRKAYDSEPVPFSLTEQKYRQGTRDVVLLDDSKNASGIFIDVDRIIDFVNNDGNSVAVMGGEKMAYIPTKTFSVNVNKEELIRKGIVDIADTNRLVDEVTWKINKPYLVKSQLMVLDLLATNNWERPIYFAVTTGRDAYLGLENYFQLEGLAYRLMPFKPVKSNNPYAQGSIDKDLMYDNMMNKFAWGNMDSEELYMDENNLRMTTNLRLQFANLAEEFLKAGDNATAEEIVDKAMAVMPEKNVPYNRIVTPLIEVYYNAGAKDKGAAIAERLFNLQQEELEYFISLDDERFAQVEESFRINMYTNKRIIDIAKRNGQTELAAKLEDRMKVLEAQVQQGNNVTKASF